MSEIRRVLRAASLRMLVGSFLRYLVLALTAGLVAGMALRVATVMLGVGVDWSQVATWGGAAVVGIAGMWTLFTAPRAAAVARRVDEGADLRETISTALSVQGSADAWAKAVVEAAALRARTVNVRQAVPVRAPRTWPMPLTAALALVVVWLLPIPRDVLGKQAAAEKRQQEQKRVEIAQAESKAATAKVEDLLKKLDPKAGEEPGANKAEPEKPQPTTPEEISKAAIKKLEGMKDKIEKMRSESEKAQAADALKDMLKQLKNTPGPMEEIAKNMAKGDMKAAQEALEKLQQKMASGEMSSAEKEQMGKQLQSLKAQLEKVAASQKDLEDKLKAAGIDPKLAKNSEELRKALENAKNLTEEQKQQMQKQAQAQQKASESCQSMAQCMNKMAEGMKKQGQGQGEGEQGQQGQAQQAMQELSEQMSEMEMMMAEAEQMDAAMAEAKQQLQSMCEGSGQCNNPGMGECQNGLYNNPWAAGNNQNQGANRGGHGQAQGGSATESPADETWTKRNFKSQTGQGPIIGSTVIQGEQIKGESVARFEQAVNSGEATFAEAIENNTIPREYHDVIKAYFGRLSKKTQGQQTPAAAPVEKK
jgi:chemotaxis protein histidine kinase CheA